MAAITLPKSTYEILELSRNIISRYESGTEPAKLIDEDVQFLLTHIRNLESNYEKLIALRDAADKLNQEIQMVLGNHPDNNKITPNTSRFAIAKIRDILKGIYREDLHQLKDWGFEVIEKD